MSDEIWKAIASVATLIGVIASLLNSLRNSRQAKIANAKLETINNHVNGKMELLLKAVGAEEKAAGEVVGREKSINEERDRVTEEERVTDRKNTKD